jgi:hypothetical protein
LLPPTSVSVRRRGPAAAGHDHRGRRRRRDAELGFERLDELAELEDADVLDVVDDLILRECHYRSLLRCRVK